MQSVEKRKFSWSENERSQKKARLSNRHQAPNHMNQLGSYELLEQLGKGTFGVVYKARQKSTGKLVALKKFIVHDRKDGFPITSFREITIMRKLRHNNVLQIIDMVHERGGFKENDDIDIDTADSSASSSSPMGYFYTVTPYISSDLNGLLRNKNINMSLPVIKSIMKQALQGIDYVHSRKFLHRDIKTANILLDLFGTVKLADFGLARIYDGTYPATSDSLPGGGRHEYTGLVVTRWYRAPELLIGVRKYTTAVDMWGMGCVFGELYKREAILQGGSDLDQADRIFRLLGSPTEASFPNSKQNNRNNVNLLVDYPRTLEKEYGDLMDKFALGMFDGLLKLDPEKRFNAKKALEAQYFSCEPLPCLPSEIPKYQESHESDFSHTRDPKKPEAERRPTTASGSTTKSPEKLAMPHFAGGEPNRQQFRPSSSWTSSHGKPYGRQVRKDGWGNGWTNRRSFTEKTQYEKRLPSSQASSSDLYGAETNQSFSAMRKYLHEKKK